MPITFGREVCGRLDVAESREWLVANGNGGYASGTVAGSQTRGYHGLLVAALNPPGGRTVLVSKLDETIGYGNTQYQVSVNHWAGGAISPAGNIYIEQFRLENTVPVWTFAVSDALIEKRVWMEPGANTTYVTYTVVRASGPIALSAKALVNYRDYHSRTHANGWVMKVETVPNGIIVRPFDTATPFSLLSSGASVSIANQWYLGLELPEELNRGLEDTEDVLFAGTFTATLQPGQQVAIVLSVPPQPDLDGAAALLRRQTYEQSVLTQSGIAAHAPEWVSQLILAADQFIVNRGTTNPGKTVIAGYHWFTDWGRDTMISLPGLTLVTGRADIAKQILTTFAGLIDRGMLPNQLPDSGSPPLGDSNYNTVDAALWFFEAVRQYLAATNDRATLQSLYPHLQSIIDSYVAGTRFNIKVDPADGLVFAGQPGVQLTWMDALVNGQVITPRMGKPVEIAALWYNALKTMIQFGQVLGKPVATFEALAATTLAGFQRFWNNAANCLFDVLDGPSGNDPSLRPNQLIAVSLPESPLTAAQQKGVVDTCARALLTSYGLRSLSRDNPQYHGTYGGDQFHRDSAYHQGTVWAWLMGPFALAHFKVHGDAAAALALLDPIADHLEDAGLGTISEILEGDDPFLPRGCIAQAWSVAEYLRAWTILTTSTVH